VGWYQTAAVWPAILTVIYVWKFAGYYSVIFLAAMTGISKDYYEAAEIDGATRFQQIVHITLPLIRPVMIMLALLGVGRIFYGDFGMIYGIIGDNGVLYPTTDVIDTYSFRALRQLGNFSMAAAVVLYQAVMGLIFIVLFNGLVRKIDNESKLF
jgi:putative aldouronate transport system permease protein